MTVDVFAVPIFFVVFRETLETVVIVSVLLAFLKQTLDGPDRDVVLRKKLVKQVGYYRMEISSAEIVYSPV
jgi:high-affinity iron transporter